MAIIDQVIIADAGGTQLDITASNAAKVDGSAVTQPISADSLPLPTGAATLAEQQTQTASLSVLDDWDESDRAKVNPIVGQAGVAGGTGVDGATVQRVSLATNVPLPAGTNAIGKLSANSGVDIGDVTVDNAAGASAVNIQDGGNSITVDGSVTVTQATAANLNATIVGNVAHDAVDAGNPIKIGGKVTTGITTPVADADRVDSWFDEWGRITMSDKDVELGLTIGTTSLRDRLMAQRCTILSDSLADGIAGFWTQVVANGGSIASTSGEGLLSTSTAVNGSAKLTSTNVAYYPGQVAWLNSSVRFGDTGVVGNIRRLGMFTTTGDTPQEGFYYELNGTTLNAVTVKAGVATAVAQSSWTRNGVAPYTLTADYFSLEIRYTANTVLFYINNILRHSVSGTTTPLTTSLTLPITLQNVKTSGATNIVFGIRNIGNGRFGQNGGTVNETGLSAVEALAVGGGTPNDSVDSGNPLKIGGFASSTAPATVANGDRVNAWFSQNGALNITTATGITGPMKAEDVASATGDFGYAAMIRRKDTPVANAQVSGDEDYLTPITDNYGAVWISNLPKANGGLSIATGSIGNTKTDIGTTNTPGQIYGWYIYNPNATVAYVQFFNAQASAVTLGTTAPVYSLGIPAASGANVTPGSIGLTHSTAISIAVTTTRAGSTNTASTVDYNLWYKQ